MDKINRRGVSPEDDGDYAKLRELPMVARATNDHSDDNTSEDTKVRTVLVRNPNIKPHCVPFACTKILYRVSNTNRPPILCTQYYLEF